MKSGLGLLKTGVLLASAALWIGAAAAAPLPVGASPDADASANNQRTANTADTIELAPNLRRQLVDYPANVAPGTVIIDTAHTYLYYVLGDGKAIRYGIGVGRQGFTWSGIEKVTRKAEWPDWTPPAEMIGRQPYLARFTPVEKATRSAPAPSISVIRNIEYTAPTCRRRLAPTFRVGASACLTPTSSISTAA